MTPAPTLVSVKADVGSDRILVRKNPEIEDGIYNIIRCPMCESFFFSILDFPIGLTIRGKRHVFSNWES